MDLVDQWWTQGGLVMLVSVVYAVLWCPDALTLVRSQQFVICSIGLQVSLLVKPGTHYHIVNNFFLDPPITLTF